MDKQPYYVGISIVKSHLLNMLLSSVTTYLYIDKDFQEVKALARLCYPKAWMLAYDILSNSHLLCQK